MSSREASLLLSTNFAIDAEVAELKNSATDFENRLSILEAISSLYAGWDLNEFNDLFNKKNRVLIPKVALRAASEVLKELSKTPIPIPLALAALAREPINKSSQKSTGAYYTDWKLAEMLAESAVSRVKRKGLWVDPACGAGTLLVASVLEAKNCGLGIDSIIANKLVGADLSESALRGTRLSISSLTKNLINIVDLNKRLLLQDSLNSSGKWQEIAQSGFALVIGNPPWEKLKITRHEIALKHGSSQTYGERINGSHVLSLETLKSRGEMLEYVSTVAKGTKLQGNGEHDLYKLFIELGLALCAKNGILAFLVPAGLIRSQGTHALRKVIFENSSELQISVLENRQRHFDIDTRFKFLSLVACLSQDNKASIQLRVANRDGILDAKFVSISRSGLKRIRPDLSLPEVRSASEWKLFQKLSLCGSSVRTKNGPWEATFAREVDMTNDSKYFSSTASKNGVPVIEGRHVSQYRFRSKSYVSGAGRSAIWKTTTRGEASGVIPQWWMEMKYLRPKSSQNIILSRVGFCDISGQTNERTFLAARIPMGVVCGNKVPTLTFVNGNKDREDLFLGFANSFVVDWMLRRQATTTINFFMIEALTFPNIDIKDKNAQKIIQLVREVSEAEGNPAINDWSVGLLRAKIDALVATTYELTENDLLAIFNDFPLIDRGQPLVEGDEYTVTINLVMEEFCKLNNLPSGTYGAGVSASRRIHALPYMPADYSLGVE
jgi:Alw26I/Eco31I/Esp3I family type II restriction m6 adenine DNA methyltransferase